jgi:hypothetical protein
MGWRWHRTSRQIQYIFFCGKGNENNELGPRFFVHKRIISAVNGIDFFRDRMSYTILRGCWCDTVLNFHKPTEDNAGDMKDTSMKN